ncbi:MAG: ABC transporter permease [Spirochaetales bacterium]|nr:MAG: ABC transporter permease [Spirochaetales bacterium]
MKKSIEKKGFINSIESFPIIIVFVILILIFLATATQVFSGYRIYMSFLQTVPPQLVIALGLTLVITAGEIDLSFPAIVAFSGFLFSFVFKRFNSPLLGLFLALAGGALAGYINGLLIAKIGIPSIMATLAAQFFWNGFTTLICEGLSWNIIDIRGRFLHILFVGRIGGVVPVQSIWALGLAVLIWFLLNRHKFGEAIMFIGDNQSVARVVGINVEGTKIALFTIHGVLAAFGGILLTLEMANFWSTQGAGFLLPVMAAVFIGGTSIAGGYGTIVGTFFGMFIIGSLEAGVVATGIGGYWVRLVSGLVMAFSIILNIVVSRESLRGTVRKFRRKQSLQNLTNRAGEASSDD